MCRVPCPAVGELFTKRQKAAAEAAARARGEPVDYLVKDAPEAFRWQLWYALEDYTSVGFDAAASHSMAMSAINKHLRDAYGKGRLCSTYTGSAEEDLRTFILQDASTVELMDVLDAAPYGIFVVYGEVYTARAEVAKFYGKMRIRLHEHKLAYDIVANQVVEKDSEELHQEIVVPALTLLHGRDQFKAAERQYHEALDELSRQNWGDAITDANAAVEIVARTILGYDQGQLPGMLQELRNRGLFGSPQEGRLRRFVDGLTALADIRNREGDAHGNSSDRATAWLAVHWAGALVVYLVEQAEERGI